MDDSSELINMKPSVPWAQAAISLGEKPSVNKLVSAPGEALIGFPSFPNTVSFWFQSQTHRCWGQKGP